MACASHPQMDFILQQPRRALRQAQIESLPAWDPRLSAAGNRVLRQLGGVLSGLGRMENWLRHKGRADLAPCDRGVLSMSSNAPEPTFSSQTTRLESHLHVHQLDFGQRPRPCLPDRASYGKDALVGAIW